jgi:plastocyanin
MKIAAASITLSVLILSLTTTCSNEPTAPTAYIPQTLIVTMVENRFEPAQLTVNKGDKVKWVNNGYYDHTSTSGKDGVPNGIWDSGIIHPGSNYVYVFDGIGTFEYFCSLNWQNQMVGIITVVEP